MTIFLHMCLLMVILSLEATVGLPIFFIYLAYSFLSRRHKNTILWYLFLLSLLLTVFYSISWSITSLLLLVFHFSNQELLAKPFLRLLILFLLNFLIFILANLHLNYFYLIHLPLFLFYFYKANFRNYAA